MISRIKDNRRAAAPVFRRGRDFLVCRWFSSVERQACVRLRVPSPRLRARIVAWDIPSHGGTWPR